ncbi:MAG: hypothetical protein EOM59_04490 [Clostridia bacterium]|nr:hypothetical protein [Clostridia bacterium]
MPRRDGTGPVGQGAMTGRGFGPCTGVNDNFNSNAFGSGFGRGMRYGGGMGFVGKRGFGRGYANSFALKTDQEALREEKSWIENRLSAISQQLRNLSEDNK